jgi:predicted XRE-type DNA-binding protein
MTDKLAARIKALLAQNLMQHDIAARLEINQGRVSEVKTGKRFRDTPPEQLDLGL